jgi:hypothetical protein
VVAVVNAEAAGADSATGPLRLDPVVAFANVMVVGLAVGVVLVPLVVVVVVVVVVVGLVVAVLTLAPPATVDGATAGEAAVVGAEEGAA